VSPSTAAWLDDAGASCHFARGRPLVSSNSRDRTIISSISCNPIEVGIKQYLYGGISGYVPILMSLERKRPAEKKMEEKKTRPKSYHFADEIPNFLVFL